MSRPNEPLSPEERDLAARLARLGGPREPAPALDAMILAAARAAVSEPPLVVAPIIDPPADANVTPFRPRKAKPQWPLGFGLAASLVLAAGIGWRLQGDGEGSSAESAMASAPAAEVEETVRAVILEPSLQREAPPPPPPLAKEDADPRRDVAARKPAAKVAAAPPEPRFVADAPMADAALADKAPAAAPPPSPQQPRPSATASASANAVADETELDSLTVTGSRLSRERAVGASEYTRTPLNERREQAVQQTNKSAPPEAAGAVAPVRQSMPPAAPPPASREAESARGFGGNVESDAEARKARSEYRFDDRPPVSADSPEFRQAWLQRIRSHIAKGEQTEALGSLQEFRRRYPDVELPEDLRKLAATLPPTP